MAETISLGGELSDGSGERRRPWSFVEDGPPLVIVAPVFAALVAVALSPYWLAVGGLWALAAALVALVVQVETWPWLPSRDRTLALASIGDVEARLRSARARRIEHDRWR